MSEALSATPDDFKASLQFQLDKTTKDTLLAILHMQGEWTLKGSAFSSRYYLKTFDIAEEGFHRGVDLALGQCRRAKRITKIDHPTLRQLTADSLESFRATLEARIVPKDHAPSGGDGKRVVMQHLPKLREHLTFALRQFDVGLYVPPEPETPMAINNNLTIGTMTGMLQQGNVQSTQSATDSFNTGDVTQALEQFAEALKTLSLPPKQLADIEADIATIRAQLAKDHPSFPILREAGKSIRALVEGVAAGMLTDPALQTAKELFRVLGIS